VARTGQAGHSFFLGYHRGGLGPATPSMRTTGGQVVRGRSGKSNGRIGLDGYGRRRSGCCTLVLHLGGLSLRCQQVQTHGSGGGELCRAASWADCRSTRYLVHAWSANGRSTASRSFHAQAPPHPTQVNAGSCSPECTTFAPRSGRSGADLARSRFRTAARLKAEGRRFDPALTTSLQSVETL